MSGTIVHYDGQVVGRLQPVRNGYVFEYDAAFLATGHELSPFHLPLRPGLHTRGDGPSNRLPGLFEDSLPDAWGRRVIEEQFRARSRAPHTITPLELLGHIGARTMGALTYTPADSTAAAHEVTLESLHRAAIESEKPIPTDINALTDLGSSAGGARPKALVNLPRSGPGTILIGASTPPTHEAWLVKIDTSREGADGPLEQAYALMARAAGIDVPDTRLLRSKHRHGERLHFAMKRFDRDGGTSIHHHTLAGLLHAGGGDLSYEALLRTTQRLTADAREVHRAFRRAVFNVLASNRDDHGKNHGFLYRNRTWKLGPAYDVTFRSPAQLPERGMSLAGERANAGLDHLGKLATAERIPTAITAEILDQVKAAISRFRQFADEAQVPSIVAAETEAVLQSQLRAAAKVSGWRPGESGGPRSRP